MRKILQKNMVLLDQAVYSGSSFVLTLAVSRMLTLGQFGLFSSYILALFLVVSISQAVLIQPMQARIKVLKNDDSYADFLLSSLLLFVLLVGFLTLMVAFFGKALLDINPSTMLAFGLYLAFFLIHDFLRKFFLAKGDEKTTFILDAGYSVALFLGLGIIWYFSFFSLTEIFLTLAFCFVPILVYAKFKYIRFHDSDNVAANHFSYHLKEGKWFVLASLSQWFSGNIFVLSSGVFLSIEALGALRLVQTVFGVLNIFLQSVENYIIPKVNLLISDSQLKAQIYLHQLLRKSLWFLLPFLMGLFFFSEEIIGWMGGAKYVPYHAVVKGFAILYLFIFLFYPIRILIRAMALNRSFFIAYLVSLLFGLIASPFLLQQFGLYGAVMGFIAGQIILFGFWLKQLNKQNISIWKLYI